MAQRKIDVVIRHNKRKKGPRKKGTKKKKKGKRKKRGVKGAGIFGTGVPTNRVVDSNQYWQLRAEIAGGESKVRTTIRDRQAAEDKKDDELRKLRTEVGTLKGESRATAATANAALIAASVGTPARARARAYSPSPRSEPSIDLSSISAAQSHASDGTYDSGALHSMSRDAMSFASGASGARGAPSHEREPLSTPVREHLAAVSAGVSVEGMTLAQELAEVSPEDTPETAKVKQRRRVELKVSPPSFVKATDRDAAGADRDDNFDLRPTAAQLSAGAARLRATPIADDT